MVIRAVILVILLWLVVVIIKRLISVLRKNKGNGKINERIINEHERDQKRER